MVFSSFVFLWCFLPIVFLANRCLPKRFSNIVLIVASLIFYAWGEPVRVLLLIISVLVNYLVARLIIYFKDAKQAFLVLGIVFNLVLLGYFKYLNFAVSIINDILGGEVVSISTISLPIGISFFTFQAISFIIDVYHEKAGSDISLQSTALYISFFPQLIAGPIVKYSDIEKQIRSRTTSIESTGIGIRRFIYGLGKKVLIANAMGECVEAICAYNPSEFNGLMAWALAITYTMQIYYDFSGYADMAIGMGMMFGFVLPENFNYPYLSRSIGEFWRRWHITLGSWFRSYVYIPLGGNRHGDLRTVINLAFVFFLTGLWHGASYGFVFWGLYHGFFAVIERVAVGGFLQKHKFFSHIYTMFIVVVGWVIFKMAKLSDSLEVIGRMIMPWKYSESGVHLRNFFDNRMIFMVFCAFIGCGVLRTLCPQRIKNKWNNSLIEMSFCVVILIMCIAALSTNTFNPFIYYQF